MLTNGTARKGHRTQTATTQFKQNHKLPPLQQDDCQNQIVIFFLSIGLNINFRCSKEPFYLDSDSHQLGPF